MIQLLSVVIVVLTLLSSGLASGSHVLVSLDDTPPALELDDIDDGDLFDHTIAHMKPKVPVSARYARSQTVAHELHLKSLAGTSIPRRHSTIDAPRSTK